MPNFLIYIQNLIILGMFFFVVACGNKSAPVPPEGATYPSTYFDTYTETQANPSVKSKNRDLILESEKNAFFQYPNRRPDN